MTPLNKVAEWIEEATSEVVEPSIPLAVAKDLMATAYQKGAADALESPKKSKDGSGTMYPDMSKREFFAAMAMIGFVVRYSSFTECNFEENPTETAKRSLNYADALLEALEKK